MLDTYFKSYFWTFRLLVLALIAFIIGQAGSAFIGRSLAVPAEELAAPRTTTGGAKRGPRRNMVAAWQPLLDRNVFKAKREDLTPVKATAEVDKGPAAPQDPADYNEENCQPSKMATKLVTTMVTPNPEESVAVFQDSGEEDIIVYRAGDQVQDKGSIVRIERRNVYVRTDDGCERFELGAAAGKSKPRARPKPPKIIKEEDDSLGQGITKVSNTEYTIPKVEIDNVLSNLNKIATQARIVPSFRNGKANGFKLFSIRPNSLYAKIGIQNGDIIQKINGYEIDSPDKALAIYSKLKDATNISVDLLRRGKKKSLSYNIR